jgi:lysozyme family protein
MLGPGKDEPMTKIDIPALIALNAQRWRSMTVRADRIPAIDRVINRLWLNPEYKATYQRIADRARCPAPFVMLCHNRESGGDFTRSLAQGDPLTRRSVHVPAGRIPAPAEPPFTFEDAAVDALTECDHVDRWTDWTIGGFLTKCEMYNGGGYALRTPPIPSPYVFGATSIQRPGKFVADHHFEDHNPDGTPLYDEQLGCAAILARLLALDTTVRIEGSAVLSLMHPVEADNPERSASAPIDTRWLQTALNTIASHAPDMRQACDDAIDEIPAISAANMPLRPDGVYGMITKQAVRGFQRWHGGLLDDGKAGDVTRAAVLEKLRRF